MKKPIFRQFITLVFLACTLGLGAALASLAAAEMKASDGSGDLAIKMPLLRSSPPPRQNRSSSPGM